MFAGKLNKNQKKGEIKQSKQMYIFKILCFLADAMYSIY